ncbi:hypothetical protein [Sphingobacterium wenxiniae]|uniref:Uncharacterized protein n=1 Tax=Sphingobacterium wenxiniae TaxID=683125 RepID=A0A1I6TFP4_9SPHI|nr:hypothetical protein [Sphingobacterium wenxiniae]SFS88003.1 hypothetical protein SAMN05660206_106121 [Sphingobacterium wenxiniae]
MARQKGLMKYVGTIGDVRHFKIKGQKGFFAGMVGGPTAEQIKTAPEFERTRENMNEFGGCARAGKSVRTALSSLMSKMADSKVTGRLTSVMKKINLEDGTEARGYRKAWQRSVGCAVGRKNTASEPRKILALAFERWDIFRGEDYGIGYFA